MGLDFNLVRSDESVVVATWHEVCVGIMQPSVRPDVYETLNQAYTQILHDHRQVSLLSVVAGSAKGLGDGPGREAAKRSLQRLHPHLGVIALVVEGGSFSATLIRTTMNTLAMATRLKMEWKTFPEVEAASRWMIPRLATRPETGTLQDVVQSLRADQASVA